MSLWFPIIWIPPIYRVYRDTLIRYRDTQKKSISPSPSAYKVSRSWLISVLHIFTFILNNKSRPLWIFASEECRRYIYACSRHIKKTASYAELQNSRRKLLKMVIRFPFVTRKQLCVSYGNVVHLYNRPCSSSWRSNRQIFSFICLSYGWIFDLIWGRRKVRWFNNINTTFGKHLRM